ncbi:MAG: ATP-grasp domain-containing protein [Gammaproteobacteria bacterium]|jgi:predicted ATP-grasp superfamily ATP-dependent carboligase|nr:ATP-grasp domain-containing protein [Gammaproteobacteria bacterium]MBT4462709.1 ATP-grasp domain-containing protein [Gammaproteobacteria bacterium]MBT4654415.1 ATP-grasp domain-containing protein [Gammaproteobacteria bacterium]MBT5117181.1 ATP-grasp domain-containing protein [Gammaproteobacteria bacterium]MBT5761836.1 ATP-grasp domain-containing protein [Gammaproteobacteria bacterium]
MIDTVVVINSDTSYLESKLASLGIKVFAFDYYNHNNLDKIQSLIYLESFINKISVHNKNIGLIYGSGLEDKPEIYDYLKTKLQILGNNPNILTKCNNLRLLQDILSKCNLKLPEHTDNPDNISKKYLSKPYNSSGGYNISFNESSRKGYYFQEYLPGETYSVSFFNYKDNFTFLGFNKLLQLVNYQPHPFIHAGAITTAKFENSYNIISSFKKLARYLSMNGYNSIDFKVIDNEVFILDINPRITSTFKIYNDCYNNALLNHMIDPGLGKVEEKDSNNIYAFVHMFVKNKYVFKNIFINDSSFLNLPEEGQYVDKNQPLLSIYINSFSESDLLIQLKEKISMTRNLYNCYDIDI